MIVYWPEVSSETDAETTLLEVPWQPDFEAAIATEITRQSWSLGQGWFRPRKNN